MPENRWNDLTINEISMVERMANRIKDEYPIDDIMNTFESMGFPLLYDCPGFYNKFLADTAYNQELIEDYCFDQM